MTISLFAGQGSQYEGMGRDIAEAFPAAAEIYDTGSEILGTDLRELCFNAPIEELSRTTNAQPAIMTTSIVCLTAALSKGYKFDGVAGHSLGEYAAMSVKNIIFHIQRLFLILIIFINVRCLFLIFQKKYS